VTAFLYNTAHIVFNSNILVPLIIFSIVGAAWLIGRTSERIRLWRPRRPQQDAGSRDHGRGKTGGE
jgi:hypothetical protein